MFGARGILHECDCEAGLGQFEFDSFFSGRLVIETLKFVKKTEVIFFLIFAITTPFLQNVKMKTLILIFFFNIISRKL